MFHASSFREQLHIAKSYGLGVDPSAAFDMQKMKTKRDAYIKKLNGIYATNLASSGVEVINGWCSFDSITKDASGIPETKLSIASSTPGANE